MKKEKEKERHTDLDSFLRHGVPVRSQVQEREDASGSDIGDRHTGLGQGGQGGALVAAGGLVLTQRWMHGLEGQVTTCKHRQVSERLTCKLPVYSTHNFVNIVLVRETVNI